MMLDQWMMLLSAAAHSTGGLGGPAEMWAAIVKDFSNLGEPAAWQAFLSVLAIDLVMAGDNAIVVGALAAGLPPEQRKKVILIGIIAALVLRIIFALIVVQLLQIVGLIFAGGLLLLWVSWKFWRELHPAKDGEESPGSPEIAGDEHSGLKSGKSFASAAWAVAVADVSMSLDNVLGVAGAAKDHPGILIIGLLFAVALMGLAANFIAKIIDRHRWVGYLGLVVIIWVAGKMIYEGYTDPVLGVGQLFS